MSNPSFSLIPHLHPSTFIQERRAFPSVGTGSKPQSRTTEKLAAPTEPEPLNLAKGGIQCRAIGVTPCPKRVIPGVAATASRENSRHSSTAAHPPSGVQYPTRTVG